MTKHQDGTCLASAVTTESDRMVELCFVKICFCHEWRNLLYLRDKKENRTLFFPYKTHNYQQEVEKSCIYIKKSMN